MATSSFSVNQTAADPTINAPNRQARSTISTFVADPRPLAGAGRGPTHSGAYKYAGSASAAHAHAHAHAHVHDHDPQTHASPDRDPPPTDSGATEFRSPSAGPAPARPQVTGHDGTGPPQAAGTPSSTDAGPLAKKRKTTRGLRGVANLTPEQLARKRANDREAQRAIRERQRLRTEQLEREIADLKSTEPHRALERERRQREAVEAELADVKRSLAAIVAIIQPILGGVSGVPPQPCASTSPSAGQSYDLTQPLTASSNPNLTPTPTSTTSPASVGTHACWPAALSPVTTTAPADAQQAPEIGLLNQQRYDLAHGLDLGPDRLGLGFLVDPGVKIVRIQNGVNGAQDSPQYRHVPMKHDWNATISTVPGLSAPPQIQPESPPPIYSQTAAVAAASGPAAAPSPVYAILPRNCPPTCPLDSILLDFASERRQRAAEGLSQSEILGPRYPSVSSLLNPAVSVYSHPLSKVFTDILARFPDLSALPERVAVLYVMFLLMRWHVSPTQENYLRLPPWMRPLRCQVDVEHPAWIDQVPYPRMREKIIAAYEPGAYPFENFFIPFTSTLSLNWPYEDAYVLLADPTGDELMINPVFEQHLGILENWTLGPAFERAYPELRGTYSLKRDNGTREEARS